jgi:hypothetical protein
MTALRRASCPGDVVITRPLPSWVPLPIVLGGRRVAFSNYLGYWSQFVSAGFLADRDRLVRSFFRASSGEQAVRVASALGARYVYLTGRQKVDFDMQGTLDTVFDRDGERVYRIVALAGAGCAARAPASPAAAQAKR